MENDMRLILARKLKQLRKRHGYTQQDLAEKADIDYKHIQKLESENPPAARLDTLQKLAKAFGISLAKLLG